VEQLQSYERQQGNSQTTEGDGKGASKDAMTPQQFREQVERLNREDIKQLRKERDRLLDKLAEMEAETLTGRIKAAKMSDQVEELFCYSFLHGSPASGRSLSRALQFINHNLYVIH